MLGWQRPCYLMADGYAASYRELVETTDWDSYGRGRDARCANCMAHCGYEPTAVLPAAIAAGGPGRLRRAAARGGAVPAARSRPVSGVGAAMGQPNRVASRR